MKARMEPGRAEPMVYRAMAVADDTIGKFDLDPKLRELVRLRVSQLNGCGYCINLHSADARKLGESERRLYALSAWWETPFFTDEERAILKFTDEVTFISKSGVSDDTFNRALNHLGEKKLEQLVFVIATTGSWNRIAISAHTVAESD